MSFGGLLGSLYGDLPAPKRFSSSSSAAPHSSSSSAAPHSSSSSAASVAASAAAAEASSSHSLPSPLSSAAAAAEASAAHQFHSFSTEIKRREEGRHSPQVGAAEKSTTVTSTAFAASSDSPVQQPSEASTVQQPLVWTSDKASLLLLQPISRKQKKTTSTTSSRDATINSSSSQSSSLASSSSSSLSSSPKPASSCSSSINNFSNTNNSSLSTFGTAAILASSSEVEAVSDVNSISNKCNRYQLLPIGNEYDPIKPNSYDEFVKERSRLARKREEEGRRQKELELLREEQKKASATTAAYLTNLNLSGEEAWRRRGQITQAMYGCNYNSTAGSGPGTAAGTAAAPATPSASAAEGEKIGFAQKMLEKMGWKHGEGLGRDKQGILAPLVARKTDKRSGVIIQGGEQPKATAGAATAAGTGTGTGSSKSQMQHQHQQQTLQQQQQQLQQQQTLHQPYMLMLQPSSSNASRVVLLTNLVGRGEVDEDLETETAEEAAKYGNLLNVKIKEVDDVPDDQAVRIFCEYETKESAAKAINNFNGRLFGGRVVTAEFYPEGFFIQGVL